VVAIGDRQNRVPRRRQHVDQVADLAIRAMPRRVDDQGDLALGKPRPQPIHHGDCRVGPVLHAEHDLIIRMVLHAQRSQRRLQHRLGAMQRLQDGDAWHSAYTVIPGLRRP
jgi:hypothetical protein